MPYTDPKDRDKFLNLILDAINLIAQSNKGVYTQGDYFGYLLHRLVKQYLRLPKALVQQQSFNSHTFAETTQKGLADIADKMAARLNSADPMNSAGDLNYCVSSILWGLSGESSTVETARYGMRAYYKGIIEIIAEQTSASFETTASNNEVVMAHRRWLIVRGVLSDVLDEWYRKINVPYEERKEEENGTLWKNGGLFMKVAKYPLKAEGE